MKSPSPICAAGWISMPVSARVNIEIGRGTNGTPASCSAWATRWPSSAWMPGQVARISSRAHAAGGRVALARGERRRGGPLSATRAKVPKPGIHSVAASPRLLCGRGDGRAQLRARRTAARRSARRSRAGSRRSARPADSGRAATCSAPHTAAPHDIPASTPSRRAQRHAVSIASSSSTAMTSSISSRLSTAGTKPAPMPWILCGPGGPPDSTAEVRGSTATTCSRVALRAPRPTPVIVPPVPTPATNTSTRPSSARTAPGRSCGDGSRDWRGWRTGRAGRRRRGWPAPARRRPPRSSRRATRSSAPAPRRAAAGASRSRLIPCGQGQHEVIALGRADEGERDPGVAARRLDDRRAPGLDPALALGGVDHRHADPVLDAAPRDCAPRAWRTARRRGSASVPCEHRRSWTSGVSPTRSAMLVGIGAIAHDNRRRGHWRLRSRLQPRPVGAMLATCASCVRWKPAR